MAVLARVDLIEVGVGLRDVLDEHRDGQHRVRDLEHALRPAWALLREDEPREVGTGFRGDGDVLLAREAADLDERTRQQLAQLYRRLLRPHERAAD